MITKGRDSRWLLVLNETVSKNFTSMAKEGSDLSVNSKGGNRGEIYAWAERVRMSCWKLEEGALKDSRLRGLTFVKSHSQPEQ